MIDYAGYKIICASSSEELTQMIIFIIIVAIGLIGNISKAKTQKRTGHTGDNRPVRKPPVVGQQSHSHTTRPKTGIDKRQKSPKYYEPGGFAEVLRDDESLEKTLRAHSRLALKKQNSPLSEEEEPSIQPPIESTQVMDQDLESMGQLEALDSEYSFEDETVAALNVSLETQDDLAKAVLYSEIISTPVGLRGF